MRSFTLLLGIPIAWLADRWNRVNIVGISLAVWSAFTALSGMAANAAQLALARVGVGIGEAGGSPPSHSIISDYFPKENRSTALSLYSLGIPLGQMIAFLGGGWILENLGWRNAFYAVGVPGVILALVLKLTVREPIRGAKDVVASDTRRERLRRSCPVQAGCVDASGDTIVLGLACRRNRRIVYRLWRRHVGGRFFSPHLSPVVSGNHNSLSVCSTASLIALAPFWADI
ncbi:MAG: MFS transporter [Parvularculaceae bacterium]